MVGLFDRTCPTDADRPNPADNPIVRGLHRTFSGLFQYTWVTGREPLTYYDMNLSAQDHQTFFTCDTDHMRPADANVLLHLYFLLRKRRLLLWRRRSCLSKHLRLEKAATGEVNSYSIMVLNMKLSTVSQNFRKKKSDEAHTRSECEME
ncbi:hypothetical protein AB205_0091020 [Aquarana catesbeiana]|uniref:Uncharacterized protein n=1 Tax=Aquarana catesbeiana TaxID=8400 RepID=A0A2G9P4Y7_AQUCT|nr:hypothetical protein AB205_0091020 [Aquarana catesbeiana]